jgi:hypothetical protein
MKLTWHRFSTITMMALAAIIASSAYAADPSDDGQGMGLMQNGNMMPPQAVMPPPAGYVDQTGANMTPGSSTPQDITMPATDPIDDPRDDQLPLDQTMPPDMAPPAKSPPKPRAYKPGREPRQSNPPQSINGNPIPPIETTTLPAQ